MEKVGFLWYVIFKGPEQLFKRIWMLHMHFWGTGELNEWIFHFRLFSRCSLVYGVQNTHAHTQTPPSTFKKSFEMKQENIRSSNRDKTGTISQNNAPRNMKITTYQIARIKANDVVALIWQSPQLGPDPVKMKTTHVWENKHFSWWPFICGLLLLLGIFGYRQAGEKKKKSDLSFWANVRWNVWDLSELYSWAHVSRVWLALWQWDWPLV